MGKDQPRLKPRKPLWSDQRPVVYTRGVYRPTPGPLEYVPGSDNAYGDRSADGQASFDIALDVHSSAFSLTSPTHSQYSADVGSDRYSQYSAPVFDERGSSGSAFTPVSPRKKSRVTFLEDV